jgi:hypothetical protein
MSESANRRSHRVDCGLVLNAEPSHARQGFPLAGEIGPIGAIGPSAAADWPRGGAALDYPIALANWVGASAICSIARSMVPARGHPALIPQRNMTGIEEPVIDFLIDQSLQTAVNCKTAMHYSGLASTSPEDI